MAEAQPWKRRRAVQGRESRASTWITAGSQFTVVRECRQQCRIKVRRVDYSHPAIVLVYLQKPNFLLVKFLLIKKNFSPIFLYIFFRIESFPFYILLYNNDDHAMFIQRSVSTHARTHTHLYAPLFRTLLFMFHTLLFSSSNVSFIGMNCRDENSL